MRMKLVFFGTACSLALIAACVGDDPSTGDDTGGGGGGSSDSGTDATSTTDASVGKDGDTITPQDGGADAGFSPASLPGLSLWLQGDSLSLTDGATITSWPDKSGHHNDAIGAGITFLRNSADFGGHSGVKFSGFFQSAYVNDNNDGSLRIGSDGFLIEIVERHPRITQFTDYELFAKHWQGPGIDLVASDSFTGEDAGYVQVDVNYGEAHFVRTDNLLFSNQVNRLVGRFVANPGNDGGLLSVSFPGSVVDSNELKSPIPDLGATGVPVGLGVQYSPDASISSAAKFFTGEIAEIIVIKGNVTDDQQNAIDDYLKSRYGI